MPIKEKDIKSVPRKESERALIIRESGKLLPELSKEGRFTREKLEKAAGKLLARLGLKKEYLAFAMIALNNAFWKDGFSSIPGKRRLLLLPKCLRDQKNCRGAFDSEGTLLCAECGSCSLAEIKKEAKARGYDFMIAEGSPAVINKILNNKVDAIYGVACMDSLEKIFPKANSLGVPNIALSLFSGGCINTSLDMKEFLKWLRLNGDGAPSGGTATLLPLAREAYSLFEEPVFSRLAPPSFFRAKGRKDARRLAGEWIKRDGKRLRTVFTLAAYAAAKHGDRALAGDKPAAGMPDAVKRTALAVEILHKASLVHDDIEDNDAGRYGAKTLNAEFGTPIALNAGDYLVGLGYKLISSGKAELGAGTCADLLDRIAETHLKMADGQGRELLLRDENRAALKLGEALDIYRLKTSSAFEIALYCGFRAAGNISAGDFALAGKFSEYAGIAFQIFDDIKDWNGSKRKRVNIGVLLKNPGILKALACKAGRGKKLERIINSNRSAAGKKFAVKEFYGAAGILDKAEKLAKLYRRKADLTAGRLSNKAAGTALLLLSKLAFGD